MKHVVLSPKPALFRWLCVLLLVGLAAGYACAQSSITPEPRKDEDWVKRHESMNARVAQGNVDLIMIGDSITHGWEGGGKATWDRYYADRNAVNLGISGDRTEHVLWRLDNGNIKGISPKLAVIMIGTNNIGQQQPKPCTADDVFAGVKAIVDKLRAQLPQTKILLLAIFPRADVPEERIQTLAKSNELIAKLHDGQSVFFLDINRSFLGDDGKLPKSVMPDLLHPNETGYVLWANAVEPSISRLLGETDAGKAPKGFEKLFDGTTLTGWKGLAGKNGSPEERAKLTPEELAAAQAEADADMKAHWRAEDNTLCFDGKGHSLCTARDYEDFDMLVDWKIEPKGDSGVYLRGTPQVQIWDPAQWPQGSGGLYNNQKGAKDPLVVADNPIGQWNTFRITMIGEKVTVRLNDKLVVDNVVLENFWDRTKPIYPSGQIELQNHGSNLWFKNVFIREIPRGEGWRDLFNGKDLTGWEEVGDKKTWGVENGILFTSGVEGGGWLSTKDTFSDFDLELEFRVPAGGNSGIFIRAPREGNPAFEGSEIQVLDDFDAQYATLKPWQYCSSVYSTIAPSRKVTLPAGTWEKMHVRIEGQKIQVWLNGFQTIDGDLSQHADKLKEHPGLSRTDGYIGLQNHGSRLDYRNIRIRELKK